MHDIRLIRENPAKFESLLSKRGASTQVIQLLIADANSRELRRDLEALQADKKVIQARYFQAKKNIERIKEEGNPLRDIIDTNNYTPQQLSRFGQISEEFTKLNDEQQGIISRSEVNSFKIGVIEQGLAKAQSEFDSIFHILPSLLLDVAGFIFAFRNIIGWQVW